MVYIFKFSFDSDFARLAQRTGFCDKILRSNCKKTLASVQMQPVRRGFDIWWAFVIITLVPRVFIAKRKVNIMHNSFTAITTISSSAAQTVVQWAFDDKGNLLNILFKRSPGENYHCRAQLLFSVIINDVFWAPKSGHCPVFAFSAFRCSTMSSRQPLQVISFKS